MRVRQCKELFRQITKEFFPRAMVIWGRQSRIAKPKLPLVSLTPGNVRRPPFPVIKVIDTVPVAFYPSDMDITVDLFTHGTPVVEKGKTVAYEDTALDDMIAYANFLGSHYVIDWCFANDVSISIEGDARSLTGIVNDSNYEYRAQLDLRFSFTQKAIGYAGAMDEKSVKYPMDRDVWIGTQDPGYDPDTDPDVYVNPEDPGTVYVPVVIPDTDSTTGNPEGQRPGTDDAYRNAKVIPTFTPLDSGGGSQDLVDEYIGYFTEADPQEEEYE